ncbi:hypothetical protein BJ085DRAFT_41158 [Dimargaris cristalligena]|uniref:Uncharacterized protein n=1 Tax=Dimargaris cristalligena TaxID=215637 RepID=A0A4P9ZMD3_9FUNG|nr:hypothetical protein BJ085DRAFT_41158 [Dimargaris cristalligena]|eukprot:RKP33430.1 hypothetical protein BJ085DRAFT_41158 [Dimargaris cristalligena]
MTIGSISFSQLADYVLHRYLITHTKLLSSQVPLYINTELIALGLMTVAVPALFAASLGVALAMLVQCSPSAACPRTDCRNHGPGIQESQTIIQVFNTNCKAAKAALEE